jgi:octaprenyl-diphosphate synthase
MQAVDQLIRQQLHSEVVLINQLGAYIINSGGKRLRPVLVLLAARACDYQGNAHIDVAAIIEFIHTATLLHDDVVDDSSLRRGRETANAIWGNEASVLVGDFLYSRSFQMMVAIRSMRVMGILANTTNTIAEGEVMQLLNCQDPDTTEERYMDVIHCKTAKLFEAAAQLGAVLADRPLSEEEALANYGMHLGTAFQLIDDMLDYSDSSAAIGKNIGDDLAEGKPTLPLIYAMRHGAPQEASIIREAILQGGRENIGAITKTIESTGAIAYTTALAKLESERAIAALEAIPESPYKEALISLTEFSVSRTY